MQSSTSSRVNSFNTNPNLLLSPRVNKSNSLTAKVADLSKKLFHSPLLFAIATVSAIANTVVLITIGSQLLFNISALALAMSIATAVPFIIFKTKELLYGIEKQVTQEDISKKAIDKDIVKPIAPKEPKPLFNRIRDTFGRFSRSPLIHDGLATSFLIVGSAYTYRNNDFPALAGMIGMLGLQMVRSYSDRFKMLYELTILKTIYTECVDADKLPWFADIIPNSLTLGAIPLKNFDHIDAFAKNGISSVLTCLEPFELEESLFSEPVKHEDWTAANINHRAIPTPDFLPWSQEDLGKAIEHLRDQIISGNKAYVHCKAGKGRSAAVVICYLLKYGTEHGLSINSVDEAIAYVKSKRSVIQINVHQKAAIAQYYSQL